MTPRKTKNAAIRFFTFCTKDDGNMTVVGLFSFIAMAAMGSFALDVSNAYASRTHLQTAADQAAHAALYNRYLMDEQSAKVEALAVVNATLPSTVYGQTITAEDIEFGELDDTTGQFIAVPDSLNAVRVQTTFSKARGNALSTYLMKLLGVDEFDITTLAVYTSYQPGCLSEGFVSEGVVDIQSNNTFSSGFCVHSNTNVSLSSNNTFEPGTIVSMPDLADLDLPRSGFKTNDGLETALRSATMNIRILGRIDNIIYQHENPTASYGSYPDPAIAADTPALPDYLINTTPIRSRFKKVTPAEIYALDDNSGQGRVHVINCQGGSGLTIDASAQPLSDVVIISPCEIKFSSGSVIENARIISKSSSADSISSPSGLRVGRNDNCAEGGGAQLITVGGMRFPSDLQIYGSQLLAKGDISFAANASGVQGASLISGGQISGTSNMNMGLCLQGMEDNLTISYFRLAG